LGLEESWYTVPVHIITPSPGIGLSGLHTFRVYSPFSLHDERLLIELGKWYEAGKGSKFMHRCAHLLTNITTRKNLTTTGGREFLASILCNSSTETNKYITHFAIGDDASAASVGDTALGNEVFRKAVSSALESSNVANISTFLGASEANFDWEEWGHFVDGTGTADSGILFSHHIDSSVSKSSPNTVTVDSTYSLNDA